MIPRSTRSRVAALLSSIALASGIASGATFNWNNTTGNWNDPSKWSPSVPTGTDATDVLVFAGDVGTVTGVAPNFISTNNIATIPFQLGGITLNATSAGGPNTPAHTIGGNALLLTGAAPVITQNNAGGFTFNNPIRLGGNTTFGGSGAGVVTFNAGISGFADITKSGNSTFRFGTLGTAIPSDNSWIGALSITGGTFRFNNNADSGRTALRANAVTLSAGSTLTCSSMLRLGALSGALGSSVSSIVTDSNVDNEDIVLTVLEPGSYAGSVQLGPPTGAGNDSGKLIVRGTSEQIFSGTMTIEKDVFAAAAVTLRGSASLGAQSKGAIVLAGGSFRLDNFTADNLPSRLRDGSASSTGLDSAGGGSFIFDGAAAGSTETLGRLQLASIAGTNARTRPRSGLVKVQVNHRGGGSGTQLTFQGYERDATTQIPLGTVEFLAQDGAGTHLDLGTAGSSPRVVFNSLSSPVDGLFSTTGGSTSTGWAVVRRSDGLAFATHSANGIAPVTTTSIWAGNSTANAQLTGSQTTNGSFSLRSLRIVPSGPGLSLNVNTGSLVTTGIILAGPNDYTLTSNGGAGTLGGTSPRFIHVDQANLTLEIPFTGGAAVVKSGEGMLTLAAANGTHLAPFAINSGVVRASASTISGGEIRFRGGVLELAGGGTFARAMVDGTGVSAPGTVNWSSLESVSGVPTELQEERGSGGFAALGANLSIDLGVGAAGTISWENPGFLQSGYAFIFGSKNATRKATLINGLGLSATAGTVNYNAREIRVIDNPASQTDRGAISGVVSGTLSNDLLKSGDGVLELSGNNTFLGNAIVQAGTLLVNGSTATSSATQVRAGGTLGGTGTVSQILLENGGAVAPGDGGVGNLTASGLTWRSGGVLKYDLSTTADRLVLGTGALTKGSAAGTFAFDFANSGQGGQTYVLASFGSTNFVANDFSATNLASGVSGTFAIVGGELQYTTVSIAPPEVVTGGATLVTTMTATLNGTVDPKGSPTTARFEYGTTTSYGQMVDVSPAPGSGNGAVAVSMPISGLSPLTTYHFRLVATNPNGTTNGEDMTFTTSGLPPEVVTGGSSNVTANGATLDGTVDPNGTATTARIEYGTTTAYGSFVDIVPAPGSGTDPVAVSANISGLNPATLYHFRVVATNTSGTVQGSDNTFTTLALAPEVVTGMATLVTSTGATLNGTVDANGIPTTALFEYGTTTAYGSMATATAPGSGTDPVSVSAIIDGLLPNTLYHYRLVAQNSGGTTAGEDATFITNRQPPEAGNDSIFVIKKAVTVNLLENDINPETGNSTGLTFVEIVTPPTFGSATGGPIVTYTPVKKFPASGDTFTYRVQDQFGNTDIATVTVKPFSAVKGTLGGIIVAGGGTVEDTGSISVKTSATGKLSAALFWERKKYPLKGAIGANGALTVTKPKSGSTAPGNLAVTLNLSADGSMTVNVADSGTGNDYDADLLRAGTTTDGLSINTGTFTATMDPTAGVAGHGYAIATVSKKRSARFVGRTPDGEPFSDGSNLFGSSWILDPLLYKRPKKTFLGQLRSIVTVDTGLTISSDAEWTRQAEGLNLAIAESGTFEGRKFIAKGENGFTVVTSGFGGTSVQMTLSDGNLASPVVVNLTLSAKKVTVAPSSLTGLKVKFSANTGLFSGEFKHPVSGAKTKFGAAFRRDVNEARGSFSGTSAAGSVVIAAPAP